MSWNSLAASAEEAGIEPEKHEIEPEIGAFPDAEDAPRVSEDGVPLKPAADPMPGAGNALDDAEILRAVTALVFASPEPLSTRRLSALLEGPELARVEAALAMLRA